MSRLLIFVFTVCALWDGFTTYYGAYSVLGSSTPAMILSILVACLVSTLMFMTMTIWGDDNSIIQRDRTPSPPKEIEEFTKIIMRVLWYIAFIFDLYSSFIGNSAFVLQGDVNAQGDLNFQKLVILIGITLLVTSSPIMVSFLRYYMRSSD